ncbi:MULTISPECIES: hypothetical protein [Burkholderia cepacia complex]|uniref:hypothetical protein n=1 Tax=Burkholderia cepacia complex TaxID=87882 RepID=UPI000B05917C|nr:MULTISPECIES: hypothetical protein [Burkholderia cepacia complex]MBR8189191.1 hypothetical protein [Burkholderia vietnamiensis]HDR9174398.1 hypothetical protein [Burkholderia vietnamiensis]
MRFRLLSTIALIAIVAGLYLYTTRDTDHQSDTGAATTTQPAKPTPADDADSMKNLKVD